MEGRSLGKRTIVVGKSARDSLPKVPAVVGLFWITKALTTAFGESASDWLVHALSPVPAVVLGFLAFIAGLVLQFRSRSYSARRYWFAVAMVGVFGTMAADVVHIGLGVPYAVSAPFFAFGLAACFWLWHRVEGTLSVHSITTTRRQCFYWLAVVGTFALGTAVGDFTAATLHFGYFPSAVLFAAMICVPALGYAHYGWNSVACFWAAYVLTRPVGASVADWLGKSRQQGGVGVGSATVTAALAVIIAGIVLYLARTGRDAPAPAEHEPVSAA